MALFFKKNLKWFAIGLIAAVVVGVGLVVFRLVLFVDGVGGKRVSDIPPTPDAQVIAQATITAQARLCAASADCTVGAVTSATSQTTPVPIIAPASPTPDISKSNVVQRLKGGDRITVLYLGYGNAGHEGEYLTDSMLVLSFEPKTQTVVQFNVPRDLYVSVKGGPGGKTFKSKINGVFSQIMKWESPTQSELDPRYRWTNPKEQHEVAANLAANTVQDVLGIKVDYWLTMNFDGFRTLIDKMNGVTVCVERDFVDKKYPRNDNDKIDASVMTVEFKKGCQVMSGEQAIQFARSRKSVGLEEGDFARSRRQMKVVQALKDEILKKNLLTNALGYMDALQENFKVSMGLDELYALATFFNSAEGKELATSVKFSPEIMDGNELLERVDISASLGETIIPRAGQDKYGEVQAWTKRAFTFATVRREQVRIQVLNASGVTGKANALSDFLEDRGFRQAVPEAASVEDETFLLDFTNGAATANMAQLKSFIPTLKIVSRPADKKPYENAPDLMLYLGKDYKGVAASSTQPLGQGGVASTPAPAKKP